MTRSQRHRSWQKRLRLLAALFFVTAGLLHFVNPEFYQNIVPPGFPAPALLVVISGLCEIAGGLGLLVGPLRRWAGWGLIALLVAVFPANVYMALDPDAVPHFGAPTWVLWLRLPLQGLFVAWVWYAALYRQSGGDAENQPVVVEDSTPAATAGNSAATGRQWSARWLRALMTLYAGVLLAVWLLLHYGADRVWWATVLLFGPRWLWMVPLAPLAIAAVLLRPRRWHVYLAVLLLAGLALQNLHAPWRKLFASAAGSPELRVITLNCDDWSLHPQAMSRLIADFQPDVVLLQAVEDRQLSMILTDTGGKWHTQSDAFLAVASRYPILSSAGHDDPALERNRSVIRRYEIDLPGGPVQLFNLHLMSPRWALRSIQVAGARAAAVLQAASDGRRHEAKLAGRWIAEYQNVVVAGDFNTPDESPTYADNFGRLTDAFCFAGWGVGNTYFVDWFSLRLDHVLCDSAWQPRECRVGPNVGSEHRPVLAVLSRVETAP